MVSDFDTVLPTFTLPKLKVEGFAPSTPSATPAPDNGIVMLEFEASDVMTADPVALPLAFGEKVTVNVELCEAARVNGVVIPLSENPVPDTVT